jgi:hypothetical protein
MKGSQVKIMTPQEAINNMVKAVDFSKYTSVQLSYLRDEIGKEISKRFQDRICDEEGNSVYGFECKPLPRRQNIQEYMDNKARDQKRIDTALKKVSSEDKAKIEGLRELRSYAIKKDNKAAADKVAIMMVDMLVECGIDNPERVVKRLS